MNCLIFLCISFNVVNSIENDITLNISPTTAGFFIRKHISGEVRNNVVMNDRNVVQQKFQIIDPSQEVRLHGRLGPLTLEEVVEHHSAKSNIIRFLQPSAHFVTYNVYQKDPIVRFLAHLNAKRSDLLGSYCFYIIVNYGDGKHSLTSCHIDIDGQHQGGRACYAAARLNWPLSQDLNRVEGLLQQLEISARFMVQKVHSRICNPLSEAQISRASTNKYLSGDEWFIVPGKVVVQNSQELQKDFPLDRDILLRYSDNRLKPGDTFRVDVWLESYSQLSRFKLRADNYQDGGLGFIRVIPHDESWTVYSKSVQHVAHNLSIDCRIKDEFLHLTFQSRRRLFSVEAKVLLTKANANRSAADAADRANLEIVWTLSPAAERGNRANRRMTLRGRTKTAHRLDQGLRGLVPVIKRNSLLNLASLTGEAQSEPLYVFALNHVYEPLDVTMQATCYITDSRIIDVDLACRRLIFKGHEPPPLTNIFNVTLLVKYRSEVTRYHLLRVFYPQRTVISLSSNVLQVIKGWRVPRQGAAKFVGKTNMDRRYRQKRHLQQWFRDSSSVESEVTDNKKNDSFASCRRNFQQTQVRVLARFSGGCEDDRNCWMPSQSDDWYDVTRLAASRLQASRKGVIQINSDGVIRGLSGGFVKLSLSTPTGALLCTASLTVQTRIRAKIQSLSSQLISSLKSYVTFESSTLGGNLQIDIDNEVHRGQPVFIFSYLNFASGALRTPLWQLANASYMIRVTNLQPDVRVLSSPTQQPQLVVDEELPSTATALVSLQLFAPLECTLNRRAHAQGFGRSLVSKSIISAARIISTSEAASFDIRKLPADQRPGIAVSRQLPPLLMGPLKLGSGAGMGGLMAPGGVALLDEPSAHSARQPMSALQISMYVLLAIFCLAIVIFTMNCFVMVSRHRRQNSAAVHNRSLRPLTEPHLKRSSTSSINKKRRRRRSMLSSPSVADDGSERTVVDGVIEEYADENWVWMGTEQSRLRGGGATERLLCPEPPVLAASDQMSQGRTSTFQRRQHQHHAASSAVMPANRRSFAASSSLSAPSSVISSSSNGRGGVQTMYEGQECSIRILLNPLDKVNENVAAAALKPIAEDDVSYSQASQHLYYNHKLDIRLQKQQEVEQQRQALLEMHQVAPAPPVRTTSRQFVAMAAASTGTHNSAVSGMEWDYDVMQMSYDQLMSYFDNMRESVA